MLVLLPPSETKRDGGDGVPLELASLSHPELNGRRRTVLAATKRLARSPEEMMRALGLGPRQAGEVARNKTVSTSATMPAIDRYTGVLYDALDASTLPAGARARAADTVRIHSALLGLVGALDLIPAYRLSHDSKLPELPLKAHWSSAVARTLAAHDGLLLDLRSEGYVALGPAPVREGSFFVRVLTRDSDGRVRALNHFNKKTKGEFVRSLLLAENLPGGIEELLHWAAGAGWTLRNGRPGELELLV